MLLKRREFEMVSRQEIEKTEELKNRWMIGWNIVFNIYICNLKVSFWNLWVKLKNKNMD